MNVHAGTGSSSKADAFEAGRSAAQDAVNQLGGEAPAMVFVFTSPRYDLPKLLEGIRSVTGKAHLVGATGSGEIMRETYVGFGVGVAVMVLSAGGYRFGVASAANIWERLTDVGQQIAREARDEAGPGRHGAVVLLADCLAGNLQQLFNGVYRVTGPRVPIVGGAAGDEMKFVATFVFHDDKVVEKGAVAAWISSDEPFEVITRHGWEPIGVPLLVTRAEGVDVMELDGRPAATVYEEQLGIAPGELDAANFWGTSVNHPLGLMQSDGTLHHPRRPRQVAEWLVAHPGLRAAGRQCRAGDGQHAGQASRRHRGSRRHCPQARGYGRASLLQLRCARHAAGRTDQGGVGAPAGGCRRRAELRHLLLRRVCADVGCPRHAQLHPDGPRTLRIPWTSRSSAPPRPPCRWPRRRASTGFACRGMRPCMPQTWRCATQRA